MREQPRPIEPRKLANAQAAAPVPRHNVDVALSEIAAGRPIIIVDGANRQREAELALAADAVTPEWMAFLVRHTSGLICLPMTGASLDRLGIPPMVHQQENQSQPAFAVSVDARTGVTTGISARDRALTARLLADPRTLPDDLTRPGHVLPLRVREGGVLVRTGHAEAAVDLARLAGRESAAVTAKMVDDDGSLSRADSYRRFADEHHLAVVTIEELRDYRIQAERLVRRVSSMRMPDPHGAFSAIRFADQIDGKGHVALAAGLDTDGRLSDGENVFVRIHPGCLTEELLGSGHCACGPQLAASIKLIGKAGRGVVMYLRDSAKRGMVLAEFEAGVLAGGRHDTFGSPSDSCHSVDTVECRVSADILTSLGIKSILLLTDDPREAAPVQRHGIKVSATIPLLVGTPADELPVSV